MSVLKLAEVQEIVNELENDDAERNKIFDGIHAMDELDWKPGLVADWVRVAISPQPHNSIRGTANIISTAEPVVNIPVADDDPQAQDYADVIEKVLPLLLSAASKMRNSSVLYDMTRSAAKYGLVALKIGRTGDLAKATKGRLKRLYERKASQCPFVIDVLDPRTVHYLGGVYGIDCVAEHSKRTVSSIRAAWGDDVLAGSKIGDLVDYYEYWDNEYYFAWVEDEAEPLNKGQTKHGMGFIPLVIVPVSAHPMLFPIYKCRTWENTNYALTAQASAAMNLAFPSLVLTAAQPEAYDNLQLDATKPGQILKLRQGDTLVPALDRMGANEHLQAVVSQATEYMYQSTLNPVVFGQAPEGISAGYSINTLIQGARIPLEIVQHSLCWALESAFEIMMRWTADSGEAIRMWGGGRWLEMTPDMISPDNIEVKVLLRPRFPSDEMQQANVQTTLVGAGLRSKETAIEAMGNLQPGEEMDRIVKEQFESVFVQTRMQTLAQEEQQRRAQLFAVPGEPAGPVTPDQLAPPQEQMGVPVEEQIGAQGMAPQQMGIQPMDQIAAIERGGGPPLGGM